MADEFPPAEDYDQYEQRGHGDVDGGHTASQTRLLPPSLSLYNAWSALWTSSSLVCALFGNDATPTDTVTGVLLRRSDIGFSSTFPRNSSASARAFLCPTSGKRTQNSSPP